VKRVYLHELEERDNEERLVFTGRFSGALHVDEDIAEEVEDLSFDDALAWARERADYVYVDTEDERYSAGSKSTGRVSDLPAEVAARIRTGRRRALADWWLDRGESAEPMRFEIDVALEPDDLAEERRSDQEQLVARIAHQMEEAGFENVRYSAERLEAGLRETERQWQEAGAKAGPFGFYGVDLDFELRAEIDAPEHRAVAKRVMALIADEVTRART
jgi:hypothetical protein